MVEAIDAMEALQHIDWSDRAGLKATLAATMVKNARHEPAFDTVFEVYFAMDRRPSSTPSEEGPQVSPGGEAEGGQAGGGGGMDLDELVAAGELAEQIVGRMLPGKVHRAGPFRRRAS